jgi:menaquinone-dependent protoporphyrinogen IX oxidase
MKTLIVYKSKRGSTKEYAEFVHSKISGSKIMPIDDLDEKILDEYEALIIGSATYMGRIQVRPYLLRLWPHLKDKKVFLFVVGLSPEDADDSKSSYELIPIEIREKIKYIKVPGRIKFSALNFFEKLIMKAMKTEEKDGVDTKLMQPVIDFATEKV